MKQLLLLLMTVFPVSVNAQILVCDTVVVDDDDFIVNVTQHPLESYKYIDSCTVRYSIVYDWYGRCGIYNNIEKKNITELEYRELDFSCTKEMENGDVAFLFSAKKGTKKGVVSIGPSDNVVSIMMDDDDLVYSLDKCKTIDKNITKEARKILFRNLTNQDNAGATHGQILVMDTKTGQLKTWVALEKSAQGNKFEDAPLRKHQCSSIPGKIIISSMAMEKAHLSWDDMVNLRNGIDTIGGLVIKETNRNQVRNEIISYKDGFKSHSDITMANALYKAVGNKFSERWNLFTNSPREIDALTIAAMYNYIASNGIAIEPSVDSDSVEVFNSKETDIITVSMTRELLKSMLQEGGVGCEYTTKKVDLSGDYSVHNNCSLSIYDDNESKNESLQTYNQVIFAGYLPSENPKYTICVTMETKDTASDGKNIYNAVNKLTEYLNKQ